MLFLKFGVVVQRDFFTRNYQPAQKLLKIGICMVHEKAQLLESSFSLYNLNVKLFLYTRKSETFLQLY